MLTVLMAEPGLTEQEELLLELLLYFLVTVIGIAPTIIGFLARLTLARRASSLKIGVMIGGFIALTLLIYVYATGAPITNDPIAMLPTLAVVFLASSFFGWLGAYLAYALFFRRGR